MITDAKKSRRDGILLTVGFNLRTRDTIHSLQSPAGTAQWSVKVSSLRDFADRVTFHLRRLKSTVNKVTSLRDFSSDKPIAEFCPFHVTNRIKSVRFRTLSVRKRTLFETTNFVNTSHTIC